MKPFSSYAYKTFPQDGRTIAELIAYWEKIVVPSLDQHAWEAIYKTNAIKARGITKYQLMRHLEMFLMPPFRGVLPISYNSSSQEQRLGIEEFEIYILTFYFQDSEYPGCPGSAYVNRITTLGEASLTPSRPRR